MALTKIILNFYKFKITAWAASIWIVIQFDWTVKDINLCSVTNIESNEKNKKYGASKSPDDRLELLTESVLWLVHHDHAGPALEAHVLDGLAHHGFYAGLVRVGLLLGTERFINWSVFNLSMKYVIWNLKLQFKLKKTVTLVEKKNNWNDGFKFDFS